MFLSQALQRMVNKRPITTLPCAIDPNATVTIQPSYRQDVTCIQINSPLGKQMIALDNTGIDALIAALQSMKVGE